MFEMRRASTVHRHDHFKSYRMTFWWRLFENILFRWWALCQNQVPWTGALDCIHRVRCNYLFLSLIPVSCAQPSICICVHHPIQSYPVNKKYIPFSNNNNKNVLLSYSGQAWAPFSRDFRIFLNLPGMFAMKLTIYENCQFCIYHCHCHVSKFNAVGMLHCVHCASRFTLLQLNRLFCYKKLPVFSLTCWCHQMSFSALLAIMRGIHRSPLDHTHRGQWRDALMFYLI